ncbi:MAG: peptide deformylase [bacterium]|nr:peptide deformylase [bacterium]
MAKLHILQEPHRLLRAEAKEIPQAKIKSPAVQKLIRDMAQTLKALEVGIGLAAPQVGKSLRLFLVSKEALVAKRDKKLDLEKLKESKASRDFGHLVFINPKIIKTSRRKNLLSEGCLSVSDPAGHLVFGRIRRFDKVTIQAYDEKGQKFIRGASGLLSQVLQHETDHLEGALFTDGAEEIHKIKNEEDNILR